MNRNFGPRWARGVPRMGLGLFLLMGLPWAVSGDDEFDDFEERAAAVNEGKLQFLVRPPAKPVHHHHNRIVVVPSSLKDGWVTLEQCHEHLDPVPRVEIVFRPDRIQGLRVSAQNQVGRAWVEGASIQLEDVQPGARLCLRAQSRALHGSGDGTYSLRNGPFMRRFLDGYYPMRVSMEVSLPEDCLAFVDIEPRPQPRFKVWQSPESVSFDAWFEGRLYTKIRFRPEPGAKCAN